MDLSKIDLSNLKEKLWNLASDETISVFEIETFIRTFLNRKPLPLISIAYQSYCRCSLNEKGEIFSTVNRCSYNPNADKVKLQRCNYEHQQVFYAAVPKDAEVKCSGTAILEVSWEHISNLMLEYYFVTLSRWTTKRNLNVFFFPDITDTETDSIGVKIERDLMNATGIDQQQIPYYQDVLNLFREILSAKQDKRIWYRISSAFYNCIMRFTRDQGQQIDGMIYSSANTERLGTNIVLNKAIIDSNVMSCDYVQMWMARRNPSNPKDIWYFPVSDGVEPNVNGTFEIRLYPQHVNDFNNSPPLDISAIVDQTSNR